MFQIAPEEQQLTFKGLELNNMECILNCGLKGDECIELIPIQKLIPVTLKYGDASVRLEIRPSATISGLKSLLYTVNLDSVHDV